MHGQKARIGGHHASRGEGDDVARHELGDVELDGGAVAEDGDLVAELVVQRIGGALLGNMLDRSLFASTQTRTRNVEGPRLADLDVMASTEGAPVARVYGRARLSGQVIWATQLEEVVSTDMAPGAIGPYSQAIKAGGMLFCSGQIPIDPASGEFVAGGVAEQTEQVFKNLIAVLEAGGAGLDDVVKTSVFLADMNDFAAMNEVYARYFDSNKPARATVQAAGLPRNARVEIDCIAVV